MTEIPALCLSLFSMFIAGAYEVKPGIMLVQQYNTQTKSIEELIVYTDDYLQCWENGNPVLPKSRPID